MRANKNSLIVFIIFLALLLMALVVIIFEKRMKQINREFNKTLVVENNIHNPSQRVHNVYRNNSHGVYNYTIPQTSGTLTISLAGGQGGLSGWNPAFINSNLVLKHFTKFTPRNSNFNPPHLFINSQKKLTT